MLGSAMRDILRSRSEAAAEDAALGIDSMDERAAIFIYSTWKSSKQKYR